MLQQGESIKVTLECMQSWQKTTLTLWFFLLCNDCFHYTFGYVYKVQTRTVLSLWHINMHGEVAWV